MKKQPLQKSPCLVLFLVTFFSSLLILVCHFDFEFLGSLPFSHRAFAMNLFFERALNLDRFWQAAGVDVIKYGEHYYPAFPPGTSFAALPFYFLEQVFSWLHVRIFGPVNGTLSLFMESLAFSLPTILALSFSVILVYKFCRYFKLRKNIAFLSAWALPFTSFLFTYSGQMNNHTIAMFITLLGSYLLVTRTVSFRALFLTGIIFGLAPLFEYPAALCAAPAFFYLSLNKLGIKRLKEVSRNWELLLIFVTGFLFTSSLVFLYNFALFGNPLLFPERLVTTGFGSEQVVTGIAFSTPLYLGIFGNLFSPFKGLLFYAPLVFFAPLGFVKICKTKYRPEALLFLGNILFTLVVYSTWRDWMGGWTFGPRFLITTLPYFFILLGFVWEDRQYLVQKILLPVLFVWGWLSANIWALFGSRLVHGNLEDLFSPFFWERIISFPGILAARDRSELAPFLLRKMDEIPLVSALEYPWLALLLLAMLFFIQGVPMVISFWDEI